MFPDETTKGIEAMLIVHAHFTATGDPRSKWAFGSIHSVLSRFRSDIEESRASQREALAIRRAISTAKRYTQ